MGLFTLKGRTFRGRMIWNSSRNGTAMRNPRPRKKDGSDHYIPFVPKGDRK